MFAGLVVVLAAFTIGTCYYLFARRRATIVITLKEELDGKQGTAILYGTGNLPLPRTDGYIIKAGSVDYRVDHETFRKVAPGMTVVLRQWGDHWRLLSIQKR